MTVDEREKTALYKSECKLEMKILSNKAIRTGDQIENICIYRIVAANFWKEIVLFHITDAVGFL